MRMPSASWPLVAVAAIVPAAGVLSADGSAPEASLYGLLGGCFAFLALLALGRRQSR